MQKSFIRWIPITLILLGIGIVVYFHLYEYLTFSTLRHYHHQLLQETTTNPIAAAIIFCIIYIITVALSIPGAAILTLTGGYLFGIIWGTILVAISAAIGGSMVFFATHTAFRSFFVKRAGAKLKRFEQAVQDNTVSYLLFVRLIPIFPFWLVNILAGLLNIRFKVFFLTTLFGIIPASMIYVIIGNSLHTIFAENKPFDVNIIFAPNILLPLLALALLTIIPVLYKMRKNVKK